MESGIGTKDFSTMKFPIGGIGPSWEARLLYTPVQNRDSHVVQHLLNSTRLECFLLLILEFKGADREHKSWR